MISPSLLSTLQSNNVVRPFSRWERLFLPKFPWGQRWHKGNACGRDAQHSPGTRAAGLSPSCLLPLGDSVVLSKELVIHSQGVGSFPEGLEERKETRRESGQQGRQGRSLAEPQPCTEAAAGAAAARLRCTSRFPKGKRRERNQFKGWCQCQEAHSFSKGHKDCIYLFKPLAQEHRT